MDTPNNILVILQYERTLSELKVLNYGDGKKFAFLFPDGTGQV